MASPEPSGHAELVRGRSAWGASRQGPPTVPADLRDKATSCRQGASRLVPWTCRDSSRPRRWSEPCDSGLGPVSGSCSQSDLQAWARRRLGPDLPSETRRQAMQQSESARRIDRRRASEDSDPERARFASLERGDTAALAETLHPGRPRRAPPSPGARRLGGRRRGRPGRPLAGRREQLARRHERAGLGPS